MVHKDKLAADAKNEIIWQLNGARKLDGKIFNEVGLKNATAEEILISQSAKKKTIRNLSTKCWICDQPYTEQNQKSREHKLNNSDWRLMKGEADSWVFWNNYNLKFTIKNTDQKPSLKFETPVCQNCNRELFRAADVSWAQMSEYLQNNLIPDNNLLDTHDIFSNNIDDNMLNVHLFFVRKIGFQMMDMNMSSKDDFFSKVDFESIRKSLTENISHPNIFLKFDYYTPGYSVSSGFPRNLFTASYVNPNTFEKKYAVVSWYIVKNVLVQVMYIDQELYPELLIDSWHPVIDPCDRKESPGFGQKPKIYTELPDGKLFYIQQADDIDGITVRDLMIGDEYGNLIPQDEYIKNHMPKVPNKDKIKINHLWPDAHIRETTESKTWNDQNSRSFVVNGKNYGKVRVNQDNSFDVFFKQYDDTYIKINSSSIKSQDIYQRYFNAVTMEIVLFESCKGLPNHPEFIPPHSRMNQLLNDWLKNVQNKSPIVKKQKKKHQKNKNNFGREHRQFMEKRKKNTSFE